MLRRFLKEAFLTCLWTGIILGLAFLMDQGIDMASISLNLCEHGTSYLKESANGGRPRCNCSGTPFNGTYCSMCTCKYGECSTDPTTPNKHGRYGCKCPEGSKRFGHMCDKCNTIDSLNGSSYCNSTCKTNYFGQNCNTVCFSKLAYANNNSICNSLRSDGGACHTCHGHDDQHVSDQTCSCTFRIVFLCSSCVALAHTASLAGHNSVSVFVYCRLSLPFENDSLPASDLAKQGWRKAAPLAQ